jgi:hypothetical protein
MRKLITLAAESRCPHAATQLVHAQGERRIVCMACRRVTSRRPVRGGRPGELTASA